MDYVMNYDDLQFLSIQKHSAQKNKLTLLKTCDNQIRRFVFG